MSFSEGEESDKSAGRAKHPDEFRKSSDLKIGEEVIVLVTPCSQLWLRRL
jgi:hypothetical protein